MIARTTLLSLSAGAAIGVAANYVAFAFCDGHYCRYRNRALKQATTGALIALPFGVIAGELRRDWRPVYPLRNTP